MGNGNNELTIEKKTQEEIRIDIGKELNRLHTWDLQEKESLQSRRVREEEQLVTRQIAANEVFAMRQQQNLPPVEAKVAAEGSPVQTMEPAKKSWKQRKEEEKS